MAEKTALEPDDFLKQPFIALGRKISTRSDTDAFLALAKARPAIIAEAQWSAAICELVANGAGLSIIEPGTAFNFAAADRVVARPLCPEQLFTYALLLPALRNPSCVAVHFIDLMEAKFVELLPL